MLSKQILLVIMFSVTICVAGDQSFEEIIEAIPFETSCSPEIDCSESEPGALVPDPLDCHSYYFCISSNGEVIPSDVSIMCPDGQYFDTTTSSCQVEMVPCTNECGSSCTTTCSEAFDIVGYPGDCTKYYVCIIGGDEVAVDCPDESPYFDGENCTTNAATCCDFCTPACDQIGIEVADPYDCTMFYICFQEGTPDESSHFSCPSGEIFDSGSCIPGTECTPLCSSGSTTVPTQATTLTSTPTTTTSTNTSPPSTTSSKITSTSEPTTTSKTTTMGTESTTTQTTTTEPTTTQTTTTEPTTTQTTTTEPITTQTTTTEPTTTQTTTTMVTTPTTTTEAPHCKSHFDCPYDGNFARCNYCDPSFFHCHHGHANIHYCNWYYVFNTNPMYPYCVSSETCPYPW